MKITIGKLSPRQLIEAVREDFQVEVTPEMMKALTMDEDARRLFVQTKAADPDTDERIKAMEIMVKAMADGLPAMIEESVKKVLPQGEPIAGEVLAKLKAFDGTETLTAVNALKAEVTNLKTEVTGLAEKAAQAALTAESVKTELANKLAAPPVLSGTLTPQQAALVNQMGNAPQSPFARNVALNQGQ